MPVPVHNTSMALLNQSDAGASHAEGSSRQPRQPTSLQGLLRFSMEATRAEDAPRDATFEPMDEERRKFLENALKSMTVDVVEILRKQIDILKKVEQLGSVDDSSEYMQAIETILDYVDNIDIANDFHKIGGFMILHPCFKCLNAQVRAGGCEILAVLCQNNPYCQQVVLDNKIIPCLINMIENDENSNVVVKALYGLSSIVRDNSECFNELVEHNGLIVLLNALKKNNEKFIIKACFLLASVCRSTTEVKNKLITLGYVSALIDLFSMERSPSHEHVLALLVCLVEDNQNAIAECRNSSFNLKDLLHRYIVNVRNKDECQEEEEYCKRLLHVLNSES
ncbi:unnamed protein product [Phaedon cochleariae]|uniref:Nucleotide exchange factor Fes1 domain-containing protein n=1 Tax=Phaedon cochleariae TaxID=80249 RepID=A0A9P0GKV7_PHACE|nr:unnamed protein product [Phaedon cochleariae]